MARVRELPVYENNVLPQICGPRRNDMNAGLVLLRSAGVQLLEPCVKLLVLLLCALHTHDVERSVELDRIGEPSLSFHFVSPHEILHELASGAVEYRYDDIRGLVPRVLADKLNPNFYVL